MLENHLHFFLLPLFLTGKSKIWTVSLTLPFAFCCICYYNHTQWPQETLPLCLNIKHKCLCPAHREPIWPAHLWKSAEKKKLTHLLSSSGQTKEMFHKTNGLFTPFCSILKKKSSWTPNFPNKVTILCLCTLSPNLLACHLQSKVRPETFSYSSFLLHTSMILSKRVCFYKTKKPK